MDYKVTIDNFEGPLDLLLHLIKEENISINDIDISKITNQYLDFIKKMEELNLNIASSYLVMAASLIEIKSASLLPKIAEENEEEIDQKEELINKLLEYQKYKELTSDFRTLESERSEYFTKEPSDFKEFRSTEINVSNDVSISDLLEAFQKFLDKKQLQKPLNTKIMRKEYSVSKRSFEIKKLLKEKKKLEFSELFDVLTKDYVVVTFLAILDLAGSNYVSLTQETNFDKIYLIARMNHE